jgi:hypothetical protein
VKETTLMSDTKETLEGMAEKFEPATDGFARCLHLHAQRRQRRQRALAIALSALLVAAASIAGIEASRANAAKFPSALHFSKAAATQSTASPQCSANANLSSYAPTLSSASGVAGSTITVSGPLPVQDEAGTQVGQTADEIIAYWNLDLNNWESALTAPLTPTAAVAGSHVQLLGTQDVASVCNYNFEITIPSGVTPGTYPVQLLLESSDESGVTTAPMPPVNVRVTG